MKIISPSRIPLSIAFVVVTSCLQTGCFTPFQSSNSIVHLGNEKRHLVQGEPAISITPLLNRKNEVLGAIVRFIPNDTAAKEMTLNNSPNPGGATVLRTKMMVTGSGIDLLADQQLIHFDEATLLGGPWIYYLNEAESFRRIPVNVAQIKQFEAALSNQGPVEFVAQWCDKQPGQPLGGLSREELLKSR